MMAVSLFAGIGGIDLALHRAGIPTIAAVEIDPAAQGVLHHHHPHVTLFNDIREVTGAQLIAAGFDPARGIITAGWPCTGNSVAGARQGMDDPRSGLWRHVVRLLSETRPAWFLGENVVGLLSVRDGRDWATVLHNLADLGMGFAWRVLDAQFFGVPQRRRRVFIVGCAGGDPTRPVQILFEPESRPRHPPTRGTPRPDTAPIAALSTSDGGVDDNDARGGQLIVGPLLAQGSNGRGHRLDTETVTGGQLVVAPLRAGTTFDDQQTGQLIPVGFDLAQITSAANRSNPQPGDPQPTLAVGGQPHIAYALRTDPGGADASEDGTGRGTPLVAFSHTASINPQAGTLTPTVKSQHNTAGVATTTPTGGVRRLTPLECERLMGLPDHWTAFSHGRLQADSARYRQLGNSVAVPVVEWIAHRITATVSSDQLTFDLDGLP